MAGGSKGAGGNMGKRDDYKWKVSCVKEEEDDKRRRDRLNGKDVIKGGYQIDTGVLKSDQCLVCHCTR